MCDKKEEQKMIAPATKPINNIVISDKEDMEKITKVINNPKEPNDFVKAFFKNFKRKKTED